MRFVSQIVSSTHAADGTLIDGDPEQVAEVTDVWTFARDVRSKDPNWKLVATEAGSVSPARAGAHGRECTARNPGGIGFAASAGWERDDHDAALACLPDERAANGEQALYDQGARHRCAALARIGELALAQGRRQRSGPAVFRGCSSGHSRWCRAWRRGFVTGYFEPELEASPVRTARFTYPLYARPPDLADIDDATRPPGLIRPSCLHGAPVRT